jgi:hypothetical protein
MGKLICNNSIFATDTRLSKNTEISSDAISSLNLCNSTNCNNLKNYKKLSNFINKKASLKTHKMGKSVDDTHLIMFHQNIRGLRKKTNELLCHLSLQLPHILCFTEHHLTLHEIQSVYIDKFTCGAYYC